MAEKEAKLVGRRWSFCAEGYNHIIQQEFQGEIPEKWTWFLKKYAPTSKGRVLDIGTGPGFFAILFGQMGWKVTGIDCSDEMIKTAAINAAAANVDADFMQMDNHCLQFPDNTFDYIVSRNVTWILYDPEVAFKEWLRVLKPGGRILYFDANWPYEKDKVFLSAQKKDEEKYRDRYGEPINTYTGDKETNEEFRKLIFFKSKWRPVWDVEHLPQYGYENIQVIPRVNEQVYSEPKQLLYQSIPMFMVTADKPSRRGEHIDSQH
ncbi:MAG: methyltransferase domain-containing protein [Ruminococcus sp.]|jgi:ubiquinone/menaquinone biosynthesis C-methylase UbiE